MSNDFSIDRRTFLASALATATARLGISAPSSSPSSSLEIVLCNPFKTAELSWPQSLIRHALTLPAPGAPPAQYRLVETATGNPVPFQWTDLKLRQNGLQSGTVNFLSDLPPSTTRRFRLEVGTATPDPSVTPVTVQAGPKPIIDNGLVRAELPDGRNPSEPPVVRLGNATRWLATGVWSGSIHPQRCWTEAVATGPIVSEHRVNYLFADGRKYTVLVRCRAGAEFVELEEATAGFTGTTGTEWKLIWDGIDFEYRYNRNRPGRNIHGREAGQTSAQIPWEPIAGVPMEKQGDDHPNRFSDQKLGPEGRLPMKIAPYHNWLTWWRTPAGAFWNDKENISAGLFITDILKWDDQLYGLWGSKDALCIHFHLQNGKLEWRFPVRNGTRAIALAVYPHEKDIAYTDRLHKGIAYIDDLRHWNGWVPLDMVRNWVLDFPAEQKSYPRFFSPERVPMNQALSTESYLRGLAADSERGGGLNPIMNLIAPAFDANAALMKPHDFDYFRKVCAFMAYVFADETLMPVRRMFSGHPNFLSHCKAFVGLSAFLFPQHPQAQYWADHYEKVIELNLRYHTRPEVKTWMAQGGRWTENLGCYCWASWAVTADVCYLLHHHYDGRNRILQPNISLLAKWLVNCLSAPQNDDEAGGKRVYPPQGAHSRRIPAIYQVRILGQELFYYDPLSAEHLLWGTDASNNGFEGGSDRSGGAGRAADKDKMVKDWAANKGTNPRLKSAKFTGYGFLLRSAVDTPQEMTVYLQQIDAGPNYRWGRAARGGNGVIYYFASGGTYSDNGTEDMGDGLFGDTERCTNFGVKKEGGYRCLGPYRAVGQNELTEPLLDFGFAQHARINANGNAAPEYIARTAVISESDYLVVHDRVRDDRVEGRLSWFVSRKSEFPQILQLKPGVSFQEAVFERHLDSYSHDAAAPATKGRFYDGRGNFLTVVTHRTDVKARATDFGCEVECDSRKDLILHQPYKDTDFAFEGTSGLLSRRKDGDRAALFEGTRIELDGVAVKVLEGVAGVGIAPMAGGLGGTITNQAAARVEFSGLSHTLYIDGVEQPHDCRLHPGVHRWQWSSEAVIPGPTRILGSAYTPQGFTMRWEAVPGAASYVVEMSEDGGTTWKELLPAASAISCSTTWLGANEKFHLRVVTQGKQAPGPPSADYPVYHPKNVPHYPEGLRVRKLENHVMVSWGEVLGVNEYRLYGRSRGETGFRLVYQGPQRDWKAEVPDHLIREYRVTCHNGFGESLPSEICDTDPQRMLSWDPRPHEGFRRDTESFELGYGESDDWIEEQAPTLTYPV